ncbi:hypothetical protein DCAR_0728421 [Daucus carota subsp. sativus]|uniref:Uncharacterized protein n=1 Tax=Daucus carota subsp. sativus TaxID=79200 RepID=A0AAF0XJ04_DAUCS|nr:hypothetical protein DCAR_0728421 [Daucus carota subsp. sativus]
MDAHDHLAVVDGSKMTWNVRVRVTRIWPSTIPNGVIVRWNLLLLDSEIVIMASTRISEFRGKRSCYVAKN